MAVGVGVRLNSTRAIVPWIRQLTALLGREFRHVARDRVALSMTIIAPVAAAIIGSIALGAPHEVHMTVALVTPGVPSQVVEQEVSRLGGQQIGAEVVASEEEARAMVRDGKATAAVVVPPGNGPVRLIANRSEQIPEAITRDLARLTQVPSALETVERQARGATPPVITEAVPRTLNGGELYGPVVAVFFLFLTTGIVARSLHGERGRGTMARMRVAGVSGSAILAAKGVAMLLIGVLELTLVLVTMSIVFGASWGNLIAVSAVAAAITLCVGAMALFIAAVSRSFEDAIGLEIVIALGLAALGGNLVPLQNLPEPARAIANVTPNGVAIRAFREVAAGGGLGDVVVPVAIILALTVVLGWFALARAHRIVAQ